MKTYHRCKIVVAIALSLVTAIYTAGAIATENVITCEDRGEYPWGWDPTNLVSCRLDEQCLDSDGDGWGWDGYTSCLVTDNNQRDVLVDENLYVGVPCIDTDGDGWGWQKPVGAEGRSCQHTTKADVTHNIITPDGRTIQTAQIPVTRAYFENTNWLCNEWYVEQSLYLTGSPNGHTSWDFYEDGTGYWGAYRTDGKPFTWSWTEHGAVIDGVYVTPFTFWVSNLPEYSYWINSDFNKKWILPVKQSGNYTGGMGCTLTLR